MIQMSFTKAITLHVNYWLLGPRMASGSNLVFNNYTSDKYCSVPWLRMLTVCMGP